MKYSVALVVLPLLLAAVLPVTGADPLPPNHPYRVARIFHPGGGGGWDYVTVDPANHLLFIPRATHTQVLDAATGGIVADIPGQKHNHGVALVPGAHRGFISDGGNASVVVFDLNTYQVLGKIAGAEDADDIIYDAASDQVLVVCGDTGLLLPVPAGIAFPGGAAGPGLNLGGKLESLAADGKGRAFVNLTDKNLVAVVDTRTMKVLARWPTAPGGSPVGLAIDPIKGRLFVGCRKPQKLIVMSTEDGRIIADLPIGAGVDATGFAGDAFASCRDGTLTVARETAPGRFEVVQTVPTRAGARTLGLDPSTRTLYLPTAEFEPSAGKKRPVPKPGTFMIVVVNGGS